LEKKPAEAMANTGVNGRRVPAVDYSMLSCLLLLELVSAESDEWQGTFFEKELEAEGIDDDTPLQFGGPSLKVVGDVTVDRPQPMRFIMGYRGPEQDDDTERTEQ
jgi:hypothetical protein